MKQTFNTAFPNKNGDGFISLPVEGRKIPSILAVKLFAHKFSSEYFIGIIWTVSELTTGRLVARGKTQKEAILEARTRIAEHKESVASLISKTVENFGRIN